MTMVNAWQGTGESALVPPRQVIWGLLTRKERWGLSWRGWLIVFLVLLSAAGFVLLNAYPFLAVTHRVDAKVLVVEGWVHEYAIRAGVKEFRSNHYERVFTTGGPVDRTGGYTNDYNTSASVGAALLKESGLSDESVQMVPSRVTDRDRTYSSAVALRNWLREHNVRVRGINVVTEDVHARRTWLLFQEAFGKEVKVGIIAVPDPDYNADNWWRSSEGFRDIVGEAIAYLYARLFFYPSR